MQDNPQRTHEQLKDIDRSDPPGLPLNFQQNSEYELSKPEYPWLLRSQSGHYCEESFQSCSNSTDTYMADVERGDSVSQDGESRVVGLEDSKARRPKLLRSETENSVQDANLVSDPPSVSCFS